MIRRNRDSENYDSYERDNFNRDDYSSRGYDRSADNNFDRMYDSREYSRSESPRRYDERGGYIRGNEYGQDGRYQPQDRMPYDNGERDYGNGGYPRYDERPVQNGDYYDKYPSGQEGPRQTVQRDNQVVFSSPKSYQDIQNLIDSLKKKQSLIVDVSELDSKDTQRYLDFLSGAIYALNGSYQKIDNKKFYFAPQGVSITIPYDLRQKKE